MDIFLDRLQKLHEQQPPAKILDVGGWFAPCKQATHMIDIMPFDTMNVSAAYGYGEMKITKENYLEEDLGKLTLFPFEDDEFDFVICRHTLEDIRDPIGTCRELSRVAKAGYMETPHRVYESTKGVERHWWCGHYHHRWLVEVVGDEMVFQFKSHNIHSSRKFHFRRYPWQKVREEFKNTHLLWEGSFKASEKVIIDYGDVKTDLQAFKRKYSGKNLFRHRWQ